jgi:hypothetical protein
MAIVNQNETRADLGAGRHRKAAFKSHRPIKRRNRGITPMRCRSCCCPSATSFKRWLPAVSPGHDQRRGQHQLRWRLWHGACRRPGQHWAVLDSWAARVRQRLLPESLWLEYRKRNPDGLTIPPTISNNRDPELLRTFSM